MWILLVMIIACWARSSLCDEEVREGRILNKRPSRDPYVKLDSIVSANSLRDSLIPPCINDPAAHLCVLDANYPRELVRDHLVEHGPLVDLLFSQLHRYVPEELISLDNVTHSYRSTGSFACESEVAWVRPGWARDILGRWFLIVNTGLYPQSVRTEICKFAEKKCEYIPPCYKSSCKQRYAHTHLLALDGENLNLAPSLQLFPIPSSCSCFVENFTYY